ncbi:MipA/OmpV family protein [Kordiimonas aestuarii]|uniref:MipA/OmpV family protein n=1 Tax=Kordiimonas aestuarii TaxID=1005925 RepID=UPI0021D079AB|nr:MipA/OmpV family protein [Kordiimonas aestuarii]
MGTALKRYITFLIFLTLTSTLPARAGQSVDLNRSGQPVYIESVPVDDERRKDSWVGQLGVGLNLSPDFLGAGAHEVTTAVDLRLSYKDTFFLENNKIGAVVTSRRFLRAGIIARLQDGRRDDLSRAGIAKSDALSDAVEIGVFAGTSFYKLFLSAEAYWGVGSVHGGMSMELEAGYLFELNSSFKLVPVIGMSIGSRDYLQAYYGVGADHPTYTAYHPSGGAYEVHAELSAEHRLAKNWLVKGSLRASKLKDNAFDSPFARESRAQLRAFLGLVWLF